MPVQELEFIHRFVPAAAVAGSKDRRPDTLLLLHGTGGNEEDLLPLGPALLPGAALLSPRGKVLENGMPRFFRRLSEGVFDVPELKARTHELASFIASATARYGIDSGKIVAVGYSNGANIASSLLLLYPRLLRAAVLFRGMVPFIPDTIPNLKGTSILIASGERDPIVPRQQVEDLKRIFESGQASVALHWHRGGHPLGQDDVAAATEWLSRQA